MIKDNFSELVNKIFYEEIVPECANRTLSIGDFSPTLYFKTQINYDYKLTDKDINPDPILIINNKEEFDKFLCKYAKIAVDFYANGHITHDNLKYVMSLVFANASDYELSNPIMYLDRRIKMLENNLLFEKQTKFLNYDAKTEIVKANVVLEAPYIFKTTIFNEEDSYMLPNIMFGICDDTAYVYAIQNKFKEKNKLQKKINRLLFKFNDGFKEEEKDELLNGTDVTMSFIASILTFINYLNENNISKIKIMPQMPIRYNSHYESYNRRLSHFKEVYTDEEFIDYKNLHDDINKSYDDNIYMKIIRTFYRMSMQGDVINMNYSLVSLIDGLDININSDGSFNNDLYNEIYNKGNSIK